MFKKILTYLGGRKFVGFILIFTTGLILQLINKFDANFSYFLLGLLGVFGVSNAVSKFGRGRNDSYPD